MSSDEDPFELIDRGNSFEAACDYWRSAECYSRSSICLRCRADGLSNQLRNGSGSGCGALGGGGGGGGQNSHSTKLATQRIIALYRAQSLEYMYKARHSLLEALQFENAQDRARTLEVAKSGTGSLDPLCSMISPEDRLMRKEIFELLFSGRCDGTQANSYLDEHIICTSDKMNHTTVLGKSNMGHGLDDFNSSNSVETVIQTQKGNPLLLAAQEPQVDSPRTLTADPSVNVDYLQAYSGDNCSKPPPLIIHGQTEDCQQSIESRLAKLDSSLLPSVRKSSSRSGGESETDHRVNEIKLGLGRLGVSLPDSTQKNHLLHKHNITNGDEVKQIIEQVSDEVRVERGLHMADGGNSNDLKECADEYTDNNDDGIDENDSMFEGFEDDEYNIDTLLTMSENLVAKLGVRINGEDNFSTQVVQIKRIQALLLEARLCLELDDASSKNGDEQLLVSVSKGSIEKKDERGSTSIMKNKAAVLVETAHFCITELLQHW